MELEMVFAETISVCPILKINNRDSSQLATTLEFNINALGLRDYIVAELRRVSCQIPVISRASRRLSLQRRGIAPEVKPRRRCRAKLLRAKGPKAGKLTHSSSPHDYSRKNWPENHGCIVTVCIVTISLKQIFLRARKMSFSSPS